MKYMAEYDTVRRDELQASGDYPIIINNVNVAADAELKRGDIISAETATDTFKIATAADTSKMLGVVMEDFNADSDHKVCAAYMAGSFHREKLTPAGVADALELELKRQGIFLTSIRTNYQPAF